MLHNTFLDETLELNFTHFPNFVLTYSYIVLLLCFTKEMTHSEKMELYTDFEMKELVCEYFFVMYYNYFFVA